jgi:hypothetical protein
MLRKRSVTLSPTTESPARMRWPARHKHKIISQPKGATRLFIRVNAYGRRPRGGYSRAARRSTGAGGADPVAPSIAGVRTSDGTPGRGRTAPKRASWKTYLICGTSRFEW